MKLENNTSHRVYQMHDDEENIRPFLKTHNIK